MHRDLKPENLLMASETEIKLADFGFATFFTPTDGLQQRLGSPMYMAPELVLEQKYDAKVDIWSIGVITHILLTGCPPFFGQSKNDMF